MFGRIFDIMFGRTLIEYCVRKDTFRVLCLEGHFLSIVFGRTLFKYCVRKDTFHYVWKDTYMTLCSEGHIDIIYFLKKKNLLAPMFLQLALLPLLGHKKAIGTLGYPKASKLED